MWPSFDVILADQVSVVIPLLKLKKSAKVFAPSSCFLSICDLIMSGTLVVYVLHLCSQVLFYCHFPDLLLAQHTTILRRIYRKPIDFIEEMTTGLIPYLGFAICMG
jgi:alpha-1,3/alpha-1,6-mannosyltransferase